MYFDEYAKKWDTEFRIDRAKKIANKIKEKIEIDINMNVMEFGCGTGLVSFELFDNFKTLTLIDSSKNMLEIAELKIKEYKTANIKTRYIDIMNEDIEEKYDLIYTSMALHHIKDIDLVISKLSKLLTNEGKLCIIDLDEEDGSFHHNFPNFDGHNGFNQKELQSVLEKNNFKEIESEIFFYEKREINNEEKEFSLFIMVGKKNI